MNQSVKHSSVWVSNWKLLTLACASAFAVPGVAQARICTDMTAARAGTSSTCAVKRIGTTEVAVPKLVWTKVANSDALLSAAIQGTRFPLKGKETVLTANRSALALGMDSKEVTAALQTMPNNTPFVVAKFDPAAATLIIDLLKVEKYTEGGMQKVALFSTNFTPEHGNMWAAARAYISPSDKASGMVAGKNPFAAYDSGDQVFRNISVAGAHVAMGHAMRLVGAPMGLFMATNSRIEPRMETSGDLFTKKTTVIYEAKVHPDWYIVQPPAFLRGGDSTTMASICVNDMNGTDCPLYATATSGMNFEYFKGGMLDMTEETFELRRESHRGLSLVGQIVVSVLASYAMVYAYSAITAAMSTSGSMAAGAGATAASSGASTGAGVISTSTNLAAAGSTTANVASSVLGSTGTMGANMGIFSGMTTAQGVALEVGAKFATATALGGSSGSTYNLKPQTFLGHASVQKGVGVVSQEGDVQRLRGHTQPRMTTSIATSGSGAMAGFNSTILGTCDLKTSTRECIDSGKRVGVALRADQYVEQPLASFVRDNSDFIQRDGTTTYDGGVRID